LLDNKIFNTTRAGDVNPVSNIVGMFDEKEDTRTEEFLGCYCKNEGEGEERCSGRREGCHKVGILERH